MVFLKLFHFNFGTLKLLNDLDVIINCQIPVRNVIFSIYSYRIQIQTQQDRIRRPHRQFVQMQQAANTAAGPTRRQERHGLIDRQQRATAGLPQRHRPTFRFP